MENNWFGKKGVFDTLEDRVRKWLVAKHPKAYSFVAGVALILLWVAIWSAAEIIFPANSYWKVLILGGLGIVGLLLTGAFVDLLGDKEVLEATKKELDEERAMLLKGERILEGIASEIKTVEEKIDRINK